MVQVTLHILCSEANTSIASSMFVMQSVEQVIFFVHELILPKLVLVVSSMYDTFQKI